MSGGYFDYVNNRLMEELFGYDWNVHNKGKKKQPVWDRFDDILISNLVYDVLVLINDLDYYKSGDTSKETYLKSVNDFKRKWIYSKDKTYHDIIEVEIKDLERRLKQSLPKHSQVKKTDKKEENPD